MPVNFDIARVLSPSPVEGELPFHPQLLELQSKLKSRTSDATDQNSVSEQVLGCAGGAVLAGERSPVWIVSPQVVRRYPHVP